MVQEWGVKPLSADAYSHHARDGGAILSRYGEDRYFPQSRAGGSARDRVAVSRRGCMSKGGQQPPFLFRPTVMTLT